MVQNIALSNKSKFKEYTRLILLLHLWIKKLQRREGSLSGDLRALQYSERKRACVLDPKELEKIAGISMQIGQILNADK